MQTFLLNVIMSLSLLVFYVTCNDISVIYVTTQLCRRNEEVVVPTVGLPTPKTFRRVFFNVPILHRHGTTLLYGYSEKPPHLVAFYDTLGIRIAFQIKLCTSYDQGGCCPISDDLSCSYCISIAREWTSLFLWGTCSVEKDNPPSLEIMM